MSLAALMPSVEYRTKMLVLGGWGAMKNVVDRSRSVIVLRCMPPLFTRVMSDKVVHWFTRYVLVLNLL